MPWLIERPLQIWRCLMDVSEFAPLQSLTPKIWDASILTGQMPDRFILVQVLEDRADIDISGLELNFVRSIGVWDVPHYRHRERGRADDCSESYNMYLGTYGTQGEFGWQSTTPAAAPQWVLPSRQCSSSNWRCGRCRCRMGNQEGKHGYEWGPVRAIHRCFSYVPQYRLRYAHATRLAHP